jgi:MbtH protein
MIYLTLFHKTTIRQGIANAETKTMNNNEQEDKAIYNVVINHEEQYSIWLADRELPLGWQKLEKQGLKDECLDYIEEVWTDMRPLSLRKKMGDK